MEQKELLPAIDMLMHHTGKSFHEACKELGADEKELRKLLKRDAAAELIKPEQN